ncbi:MULTISPECIES: hypothetical protein [Acinetobacter]|uniref:hypothetical protein n=1 Tax=Acinetobacter TaxID=469 RepID=UPI00258001DB|nr:hypothetical protein [Acinetobacter sp. UBA5984]
MYRSLRYIFWIISILFFLFFIYQLSKYNFNLICFFEKKYQYIAYIFGAIGGLFAIENFYRKEGLSILGNLSTTQFFGNLEDNFDTSFIDLTLINRKDKPVIIFDVYVKIGSNTYIHLKNATKENPIIIKGYEYYYEKFNPAYFYSNGPNAYSLKLSKILHTFSIFLHTSEGMYRVKTLTPHNQFYSSYTRLLKPARLEYENKSVPIDTAFILQFYDLKDKIHTIFIKRHATYLKIEKYKIEWSHPLNILDLEQKIDLGIQSGLLPIKNFKIIDFRVELSRMKKKFIQFDEGYNLLKIQNKIEKGDRKKMVFLYLKDRVRKTNSNLKKYIQLSKSFFIHD